MDIRLHDNTQDCQSCGSRSNPPCAAARSRKPGRSPETLLAVPLCALSCFDMTAAEDPNRPNNRSIDQTHAECVCRAGIQETGITPAWRGR